MGYGELIASAEAVGRGEISCTMGEMRGTPIREYDAGVSVLLRDARVSYTCNGVHEGEGNDDRFKA